MASHLVARALLDGWDAPLTAVAPPRRHRGGPVRSPYFGLMRFVDGFALAGPNVGFELSLEAARLWSELDGSTVGEVVSRFAAAMAVDPASVARDVGEGIRGMAQEGAVELAAMQVSDR